MDGYRISSLLWRKAILIVAETNRKKPKELLRSGSREHRGPGEFARAANGEGNG
jgi:hypothetical protein